MKLRKNKIRYVYLDSSRFFTDIQFVKMKPDERGVYCTLIFALYVNGGYIEFNDDLPVLCNCTKKKFENIWKNIKSKFGKRKTRIYHKKVLEELKISKTRSQMLTDKAVMMNQARWHGNKKSIHKDSTRSPNEKERDENENRIDKNEKDKSLLVASRSSLKNQNSNIRETRNERLETNFDSSSNKISSTYSNSSRLSSTEPSRQGKPDENNPTVRLVRINSKALKFADYLNKNLHAKTRSDRTAFNNIIDHLTRNCRSGYFNMDIFDKATELVNESKKGENPNALFMSLARQFLNYSRKTPEKRKSKIDEFKSNFGKE